MTLTILDELETWATIPGFLGYEISNFGRVRSYRRHGGRTRSLLTTPRLKKTHVNSQGYLCVSLQKSDGSGCGKFAVHALVAAAFLGPAPTGMQVAHFDGDRKNPHLGNLRYASPRENASDKRRHGTDTPGERNGMAKLTDEAVLQIRELREQGALQRELAESFGVSISAIQFVLNGRNWHHVKKEAA